MASFSVILRRSASKALPLVGQFIGALSYHHHHAAAAAAAAVKHHNLSSELRCSILFVNGRRFSTGRTSSDESLLAVIESEIKCAQETEEPAQAPEFPGEFPFKIEDNPGQQTITLTREYDGEMITVEVSMPDLITSENDEDNDADDEGGGQSTIPFLVSVAKKDGPTLEFGCSAFCDEINIDSLSLKSPDASEDQIAYEGPDFSDLDENLQKGFHKYLEIRGIKPSTANFLHQYMIQKDSMEYLRWLEELKKFIKA
ncbi:hypothetical protein Dimus_033781 [Dionaea muscipula]